MRQIIVGFLAVTIAISCKGDANTDIVEQEEQLPKVLQDGRQAGKRFSLRKSREGSILDPLYFEIIWKDKKLLALDSTINSYLRVNDTLFRNFEVYNFKSTRYYNEAMNRDGNMKDTILRAKLDSIIANCMKRYSAITKETDTLIFQVNKLSDDISSRYHFLKVMVTLPVMEQYQKDHLPPTRAIENYLKKQKIVKAKINDQAKIY